MGDLLSFPRQAENHPPLAYAHNNAYDIPLVGAAACRFRTYDNDTLCVSFYRNPEWVGKMPKKLHGLRIMIGDLVFSGNEVRVVFTRKMVHFVVCFAGVPYPVLRRNMNSLSISWDGCGSYCVIEGKIGTAA